jgi:hypothetical protein
MISTRLMSTIFAFGILFGLLVVIGVCPPNTVTDSDTYQETLLTARPGISRGQATPTLAPPRDKYFAQQAIHCGTSTKGKPIFLRIEADSDEIEVSWVSP